MEVVTFPGTVTDLRFELEREAAVKQSDMGPWTDTLFTGVLDKGLGFVFMLAALRSVERDETELVLGPGVVL